jgi:thymidylate kinase
VTRIAVDGIDAAGKTTLADQLGALLKEDVRGRYERRYHPGQRLYLEQVDPRSRADIVVPS